MKKNMYRHTFEKAALVAASFFICSGLAAWDGEDPSLRAEFVTRGAGNASDVNKAIQTINPWPAHAKNRTINMDGRRAAVAIERYQLNLVPTPHSVVQGGIPERAGSDPAPVSLSPTQPK